MTKESNGGFIGLAPEFCLCKVERIVKAKYWVQLLGKCLHFSLGFGNKNGDTTSQCPGNGGHRCDERGEDGELHDY